MVRGGRCRGVGRLKCLRVKVEEGWGRSMMELGRARGTQGKAVVPAALCPGAWGVPSVWCLGQGKKSQACRRPVSKLLLHL